MRELTPEEAFAAWRKDPESIEYQHIAGGVWRIVTKDHFMRVFSDEFKLRLKPRPQPPIVIPLRWNGESGWFNSTNATAFMPGMDQLIRGQLIEPLEDGRTATLTIDFGDKS